MEEDQSTVVEAPEVSGEKFYDVSKSLKDLFTSSSDITEENKPFSLLSSFGKSDAQLDDQYESVPGDPQYPYSCGGSKKKKQLRKCSIWI